MRLAWVRGVDKSKRVVTTRSNRTAALPSDLVSRRFTASAPKRHWVCAVTYVATWSGFAYVLRPLETHRRMERRLDAVGRDPPAAGARYGRMGSWWRSQWSDASLGPSGSNCMAMVCMAGSSNSAQSPPPEPLATATTTPSPRPSTTSTRPNSSDSEAPGGLSSRSSSRPSSRCGGGTTNASTASSTCRPRPRSRTQKYADQGSGQPAPAGHGSR